MEADLVLEGGGVKGVALTGAVTALAAAGYAFPRIAGSSAGAVAGAVTAALQHAGEPVSRLVELTEALDYRKVPDHRVGGLLAPVSDLVSLLLSEGLHPGDYLEQFLRSTLRDLGVRTWGDLRQDDAGSALPVAERYSLVVTASDLTGSRLLRLPWDYHLLGLDPDEQDVAKAVRASSSIPYYFTPVRLGGATLVDGGLLSDFPVALFDRADGVVPRWPTFGVKIVGGAGRMVHRATRDPLSYALAVVEALVAGQDASYVGLACVRARTVSVDTSDTSPVDFRISAARRAALVARGAAAAQEFLARWDERAYLRECRGYA